MDLPNKSPQEPIKPPEKKVVHQIVPSAIEVKRPATRRFLDYLFAESPRALSAKVGRDVVVPRVKAGFEEAFNSFLSGMLWGGGGRPMSNMIQGAVLRAPMGTPYHNITSMTNASLAAQANVSRSVGNYKDLVVPTQDMAELLLANMYDLYNQYRVVTVADLYEMVGKSAQISDNSYGWTSLDGARISKVRDGYLLELPRPAII